MLLRWYEIVLVNAHASMPTCTARQHIISQIYQWKTKMLKGLIRLGEIAREISFIAVLLCYLNVT
jgi:hypothetical protein